jgi:hypothetical protein
VHLSNVLCFLLLSAIASTPRFARAEDEPNTKLPDSGAAISTKSQPAPGSASRPENGYWSVGEKRWFVSGKPELGTPYAKPYVSFGYGMPHWLWAGVDLNSITTMDFTQVYGGVRASSPVLDLAFGLRDTWSFSKHDLPNAPRYEHDEVFRGPGHVSRYWAWEAEAVAVAPLPHSAIVADLIAVRTLDVPKEMSVYEESYRVIVRNPLFFTLRVAAVARMLRENSLRFGVLAEYLFNTGRDKGVVRMGPALSLQLTDHLEANAVLSVVVSSPDRLGLALGAYGIAGVRYRWATGERHPAAPWSGKFLPW